jgi:large subunit ribosomal protein L25
MEFVNVQGETRELARKKGAKAIRNSGRVPCVLYGGGETIHFSVEPLSLRDIIYTPAFKLVELEIGGEKIKCILKTVQFDPVTEAIVHVDFLRLIDGRKVKIEVPVKFKGVAPGLKSGGTMIQKLRRVQIEAIPENLIDELELDISKLELGHSIRIRHIKKHEGVEVLNNEGIPIASIEVPRLLKAFEEEEAEAAAEAEEAEAAAAEAAEAAAEDAEGAE